MKPAANFVKPPDLSKTIESNPDLENTGELAMQWNAFIQATHSQNEGQDIDNSSLNIEAGPAQELNTTEGSGKPQ